MHKIFFNTKAFDAVSADLPVTSLPSEATMLVMGAKAVNFDEFPNLKAVYRFGVGADNVPVELLRSRNIGVYFPSEAAKHILFESTANFTLFLLLKTFYDPYLGTIDPWIKVDRPFLGQQTLLVIGTGNIGSRVAKKAASFFHVVTYDALHQPEAPLRELISQAHLISVHIPLTDQNKGFIDAEKLSWMRDDVILVNTARGGLVDEIALYNRMANSNMRAAFDVFWKEPYAGCLREFPDRFLMTPHTSS